MVDIKIDELPPNVLLMRILEGMKNTGSAGAETISPLQMHRQQIQQSAVGAGASAATINLTISNLNSINSEHGVGGVNAYIRDQVKRAAVAAAAQNAETGGHRTTHGGGATSAATSAPTGSVVATVASTATTNNGGIITAAKPNTTTSDDSTPNGLRSTQQPSTLQASARQTLQTLPSQTVNSNNSQQQQCNNATSPASIPHAKALYDFDSKEPG